MAIIDSPGGFAPPDPPTRSLSGPLQPPLHSRGSLPPPRKALRRDLAEASAKAGAALIRIVFLRAGRLTKEKGVAAIVAAALLLLSPVVIHGHDPGLSSLELNVGREEIVATLSLAATDARVAAGYPETTIDDFATAVLDVRLDGVRLVPVLKRSAIAADAGTSVVVAFSMKPGAVLAVQSDVPNRLAVGHRQLLIIRKDNGTVLAERMLSARENELVLDLRSFRQRTGAATQFLTLGVSHILAGYDHLLFLAALLLVERRLRDLVTTITAFTVAHSLTLGASVLDVVNMATWIVEPLIAVSIVFVGMENLLRDRDRIGSRWKLTFGFGLIHGFGFAGALQDMSISERGVGLATALATFNLGVEAGQIGAVIVLWPAVRFLNSMPALRLRLAPICSALVVIMGAYWLVERVGVRP